MMPYLVKVHNRSTDQRYEFTADTQAEVDARLAAHACYGTPEERDVEISALDPSASEKVLAVHQAVMALFDARARSMQYDSFDTCLSRFADSPVPQFRTEARSLRDSYSASCVTLYQILDDVQAGHRAEPSIEQILAELPAWTRPTVFA